MISRALIIKQPWLDMILGGEKIWEMRSRPTNITGWIGLIEAGTRLVVGKAYLLPSSEAVTHEELIANSHKHRIIDNSLLDKWSYPWRLARVQQYVNPIPYKHPKGAVVWVNIEGLGLY